MTYITKSQLKYIDDCLCCGMNVYHAELERYTGIKARPYTAYQYFDATGDFIGDSNNTIKELLESAYIEVIDDV